MRSFLHTVMIVAALGVCAPSAFAQAARLPPEGFADLAEKLTPAVVNIATSQRVEGVGELPRFPRGSPLERFNNELGEGAAQITSLGSGFIISADGVVVTNNHVIESADIIEVILQNGEHLQATVVGRDPATDIAVLRVQAPAPLPFVRLGDSDKARVGDLVLAVGNPFGLGGSVSVGIVSARNRNIDAGRYDDFLQTDAAINRGNSGGPLFNMAGEVIGVNTAIVSPTGGSVGIGFATPSSLIAPLIQQLIAHGSIRRGWLGVRLADVPDDVARRLLIPRGQGALVTRVSPGGPAAHAGLRPGDVVLRFGGRDVSESRALTRMVGQAEIGATTPIDIIRNSRRLTIQVVIEELQEVETAERPHARDDSGEAPVYGDDGPRGGRVLGLSLSELDAGLRSQFQIEPNVRGLVVLSVEPGGELERKFKPGDVVEQIGFVKTDTVDAAREVARRAVAGGRTLVLRINREGAITYRSLNTRHG
jgi:serine protease Do